MELVREFVESVLLTGRVIDSSPVSVLMIAPPQCGKTSIMLARSSKCCVALTDATGRGFVELCKYRPEVSHFIINDMTAIMAHKQTVNAYTMSMINAMTEEGIQAIAFPGQVETFNAGKRGLIACTTAALNKDSRRWWNKTGLATRMLPFFFDHSRTLEIRIVESINVGNSGQPKQDEFKVPDIPIPVTIPQPMVRPIHDIALNLAKELKDEKLYRRLKQIRSLAKGHAIRRGKWKACTVNEDDVKFLKSVSPYISYDRGATI